MSSQPPNPESGAAGGGDHHTPATTCLHCGAAVHKDGDWWVDDADDLTCWDKDGNLGPHVAEGDSPDA